MSVLGLLSLVSSLVRKIREEALFNWDKRLVDTEWALVRWGARHEAEEVSSVPYSLVPPPYPPL